MHGLSYRFVTSFFFLKVEPKCLLCHNLKDQEPLPLLDTNRRRIKIERGIMLFPKWSVNFVHHHSFTIGMNVLYSVKAPGFYLMIENLFPQVL